MEHLVESSQKKEIFTQVELYRILKNVFAHSDQRQPIFGSRITSLWKPLDVLIEPTIFSEKKNKEADLVLLGQRKQGRIDTKPIMVIEVKRRKTSSLTKSYQSYLEQSYKYAKAIDCHCYSVYDGHTLILMQFAEPYLIAFSQNRIGINHKNDVAFAEELWNVAGLTRERYQTEPLGEFYRHTDFSPWRRSIFYFIRDAYERNALASWGQPTKAQLEEKATHLTRKWYDLHKNYQR